MTKPTSYKSKRRYYFYRAASRHFFTSAWGGGIMLVIFAIVAMILANNGATREAYHHILETKFEIGFEGLKMSMSLEKWINDALMVIFFFVVGLEIKRELIAGHLANVKKASLPIAAALGGMIVPALIYAALNAGTPYASGWGIPMATDIAFAIGILALMGSRVPVSLKVFLTALAIVDDLGAIIVIALFYTSKINLLLLGGGLAMFALMLFLNRLNVYRLRYYALPALLLWLMLLYSGVHATIAGVLIAMAIPSHPRYGRKYFIYKVRHYLEDFKFHDREGQEVLANDNQHDDLLMVKSIATNTASLHQRLEHALYPLVTFVIMPLFALANAGVTLGSASELNIFASTQGTGIYFGLLIGKPVGIALMAWLTIRLGLGVMPERADWKQLWGVAALGGIGFTMSIFIDTLAFADPSMIAQGKIAILLGSLSAIALGVAVLRMATPKSRQPGV